MVLHVPALQEPIASTHSVQYIPDLMAAQLTIRGVPEALHRRLAALAVARGQSLNATVLALLQGAVGPDERRERLARYANWTAEDLAEFATALSAQRTVDDDPWKS